MAELLTNAQAQVGNVLFEVEEQQRVFDLNYGDAIANARRKIAFEATVVTTAGLVLGGLVGAIAGLRRR